MRKVAFLGCLVSLLFISSLCVGQKKVKYKDIFGLLSVKQYEEAEPFLKAYLKENDDNPNAYLYMAIIYQEKSGKDDVLKQTKLAIAHMDSAILFYTKAYQTITEKELKKNDEYYQFYNRRDLRTGEFGVKLSDVQYDIEKKSEHLREKIDRVKMTRHYFGLADTLYKKCTALFITIQAPYNSSKEFFLRADEGTVKSLSQLAARFDSCMKAFDQYKASSATIGKIGYSQNLKKVEIKEFKVDGVTGADFYQDDLPVWDYKLFAQNAKQAIETDIFPVREHLISYDVEINKLREKLNNDSVSVRSDLTGLIDRLLLSQLNKYDEDPLPIDVFRVKLADLDYRSTIIENMPLKDSANVQLQIELARKAYQSAEALDSVAGKLLSRDIDGDILNYNHFVTNTYSNGTVLKSFIKVVKDYAQRERQIRQDELATKEKAMQWMVLGADSIPLSLDLKSMKFRPLAVVNERYTTGINFSDTLNASAYFYTITPNRVPDIKISIPLEKGMFRPSTSTTSKGLTYSDPSGQIFFVLFFSERPTKDRRYQATAAKIYRSDGLAWSSNYTLPFIPKEVSFKSETGEFIMRADAQETVIDKNGKVLR